MLSNADRQRAWRERQKSKPRALQALKTELAGLRARVAELEALLGSQSAPVAPVRPVEQPQADLAAPRLESGALSIITYQK